jgi:hypothetical protein
LVHIDLRPHPDWDYAAETRVNKLQTFQSKDLGITTEFPSVTPIKIVYEKKGTKSFWSKEELPDRWKESIIVPVHKKGDKTYCSNYCGIRVGRSCSTNGGDEECV